MPAGYIATAADFNNLAYATQFALTRPMARVHDTAGGQAVSNTSIAVTFGGVDFDPDGMWSSGANTRLTVQTPGFYKLDYFVSLTSGGTTQNTVTFCKVTTGSNNPAGSGLTSQAWAGYGSGSAGGSRVGGRASGILPSFMYALDFVQVFVLAQSTGQSTSISGFVPSWLCMELVSI